MAVRLERLKIHKFRDVVPGTELRFSHGWNVVLGRNATGKTTLLHLISMALRGDFTALRGEEFDVEYELSNGEATLGVHLKNERRGEPRPAAVRRAAGGPPELFDVPSTRRPKLPWGFGRAEPPSPARRLARLPLPPARSRQGKGTFALSRSP